MTAIDTLLLKISADEFRDFSYVVEYCHQLNKEKISEDFLENGLRNNEWSPSLINPSNDEIFHQALISIQNKIKILKNNKHCSMSCSGKYLVHFPENQVNDTLAHGFSHGFFDYNDLPAWDTWLCVIDEKNCVNFDLIKKRFGMSKFGVLCWIPDYLYSYTFDAVDVSSVGFQSLIWVN